MKKYHVSDEGTLFVNSCRGWKRLVRDIVAVLYRTDFRAPAVALLDDPVHALFLVLTLSCDYNCDSTAIRLRQDYDEKLTLFFCSRRITSNGNKRVRYVVVGW